jgi:hypothetical protein
MARTILHTDHALHGSVRLVHNHRLRHRGMVSLRMTQFVLLLGATLALGGAYCCLHLYSERRRKAKLLSRPPWTRDQLIAASQGEERVDPDVVVLVVEAVADSLGVPADRIQPADTFDGDYRLWCNALLLDGFGELLEARLKRCLRERGIAPWRPGRRRVRNVRDLARQIELHVSAANEGKAAE